jgi:hypothetical protein
MPDGRAIRFTLEVVALVALAVVLGLVDVRPLTIGLVMGLAWVIVALVEWLAWRDVPHYGAGSPPHYHVPPLPLPPPHAVEQGGQGLGYPQLRETEAPGWIAPGELRAEVIGAWPVAPLPAVVEPEPMVQPAVVIVHEPEPQREEAPELEPVAQEFAPAGAADDPWYVEQLPAEPATTNGEERLALYRLDPFAEPASRRRLWRRGTREPEPTAQLPVLPQHTRPPRPGGDR